MRALKLENRADAKRAARGTAANAPYCLLWNDVIPVEAFCADDEACNVQCFYINGADSIPIPATYEEAMASPWSHKWREAIHGWTKRLLGS